MPLVALHGCQTFVYQIARPTKAAICAVAAVVVGEELVQNIRRRDEIRIKDGDEFSPRIGECERLFERASLETGASLSVGNLEKVFWSLEEEVTKIEVPEDIAIKAKSAIDRMIAIK